jgi:hypothetical protein
MEKAKQCGFLPGLKTGLPRPFDQVFIKRFENKKASAHELLKEVRGKMIPGTPRIFGIEEYGTNSIYVYQFMAGDTLNNVLMNNSNYLAFLTPELLIKIAEKASDCFEALGDYKYVYTDFNVKNLMYGPFGEIALIDLDSAWSDQYLIQNWGNVKAINFDPSSWVWWRKYIAKQRGPAKTTAQLPKTMVLSFAAILGRAIGLINLSNPPPAEEIREFVRHPNIDVQKLIWHALDQGVDRGFYDYFNFSLSSTTQTQRMKLFENWRDIFRELTAGRFVAWTEIRQVASELASSYPPPKNPGRIIPGPKTPPIPARQLVMGKYLWDIREGLLHGLIDPFWILRRSGRLTRKTPHK